VTRLEDELRATFAARTAELPVLDDPAERAIRRAGRVRRRQAVLVSVAVVLAVSLVSVGVFRVPWQRGAAVRMASAEPSVLTITTALGIRLDLRVGNQLWTPDGRHLDLPGAGAVTWAYRVPAGWVYGGTAGTLRMLSTDGAPAGLDQPADTAVVSADGQRIAWSTPGTGATMLAVGELTTGGLEPVARTKLADQAQPVAIVGSDVMVGRSGATEQADTYDVWDPSTSAFTPTWGIKLASVYGDAGDGRLLGLAETVKGTQVDAGQAKDAALSGAPAPDGTPAALSPMRAPNGPCLIRYPAAEPKALKAAMADSVDCGLDLSPGVREGSASPDGQWLVAVATVGVMFVSLTGAAPATTRICPIRGRSAPVWEDSRAVLVKTDDGLVRCGLDGTRRLIPVDGLPASGWDLVPALGNR
jgi:hypothetical protein